MESQYYYRDFLGNHNTFQKIYELELSTKGHFQSSKYHWEEKKILQWEFSYANSFSRINLKLINFINSEWAWQARSLDVYDIYKNVPCPGRNLL